MHESVPVLPLNSNLETFHSDSFRELERVLTVHHYSFNFWQILSRDNVKEVLELKFNSVVNISAKIEPNSSSSTGESICPVLMMYIFIIIIM